MESHSRARQTLSLDKYYISYILVAESEPFRPVGETAIRSANNCIYSYYKTTLATHIMNINIGGCRRGEDTSRRCLATLYLDFGYQ